MTFFYSESYGIVK